MWIMTVIRDTLYALDTMDAEPTDFEASILESVTRQAQQGRGPSIKQHRILCEIVEKYLDDPALLRALHQKARTGTDDE
jgi:hypothetical protein